MQFMRELPCGGCEGERLNERSRMVQVKSLTLGQFNKLSITRAYEVIDKLKLTGNSKEIAEAILREIKERLNFLNEVGLGYLQLNRGAATLSGGEAQRIRLATQIGSGLTGVLYVLDEPSILLCTNGSSGNGISKATPGCRATGRRTPCGSTYPGPLSTTPRPIPRPRTVPTRTSSPCRCLRSPLSPWKRPNSACKRSLLVATEISVSGQCPVSHCRDTELSVSRTLNFQCLGSVLAVSRQ